MDNFLTPKQHEDQILTTAAEARRTGWDWQTRGTLWPERFYPSGGCTLPGPMLVVARPKAKTFDEEVFELLEDAVTTISGPDSYELTDAINKLAKKHKDNF